MRIQPLKVALYIFAIALTACRGGDGNLTPTSSGAINNSPVIGIDPENWGTSDYTCPSHSLAWNDVNDWYYQLQNVNYFDLSRTQYDLLVVDPEPNIPLNRNILDRIRCDGNGEKLVLAYLSIGKAEDFRDYWQDNWTIGNPTWVAAPNPGWEGEYIVRYWDPEWKDIVLGSSTSRLDRAIAAGFDGVVLDGVDVYRSFLTENPNAITDLHTFVGEIREYAINTSGNDDFGIFVQNAEELINDDSIDWASNITGLIKISHFFTPQDNPVDSTISAAYAEQLQNWVALAKPVLSVDYASNPDNIAQAYSMAIERGYIPLTVTSEALDNLTIPVGYEPD